MNYKELKENRHKATTREIDLFAHKSDSYNAGYDKIMALNLNETEKDKLIKEYNQKYE